MQWRFAGARGDADAVRDDVQAYVLEESYVEAGSAPRRSSRRPRFPLHERADTAELPYPLRYEE